MTKFIFFIMLLILLSCNSESPAISADSTVAKTDSVKKVTAYPYEIGYSTQFEFIDPEKGKMILELWKDFDNNTLDNAKDKFADTVTMQFPGFKIHAGRDSIIASTKAHRSTFNSFTSKVDVVMSTRSTDKNGDWVLVWGREIHTDKKNVTDSVEIHEVWGLNKEGKIESMEQYIRH